MTTRTSLSRSRGLGLAAGLAASLVLAACGSSGAGAAPGAAVTPSGTASSSGGAIVGVPGGSSSSGGGSTSSSSTSSGSTSSSGSSSGSTSSSSGSTGSSTSSSGSSSGAITVGKSTDGTLASMAGSSLGTPEPVAIGYTVHEPTDFVAGAKYPLILHSHGFGGSRTNAAARPAKGGTSLFARLLDSGYGIVSIDLRGHGDSTGTIRVLDPDWEGKDLIQLLDQLDTDLPWVLQRDGNPVMGAIGGSYGGGYQHLIYAIDPKHRLDAIAPEITWYDLRYSLNSGDVFKAYWGSLLSAAGNAAGNGKKGNMDPVITQGLAEALATGQIQPDKKALLYTNSLASYCEGNNPRGSITKIDALYMQSARDTLFNMNDAKNLATCVAKAGGDVRFFTKINGHDSGPGEMGTNEGCGRMDKTNAILAWFDEKLRLNANAASYIPKTCFTLGESGTVGTTSTADAVVVQGGIPIGGTAFPIPAQSNFATQEGNTSVLSIPLTKAGDGGAVLAGIPTISLTVTGVTPTAPANTVAQPGQPILFAALAVRKAGATADTVTMLNQWRPFRGTGTFEEELIGANVRLAKDDEVRLLIRGSEQMRYPSMGGKVGAIVNLSGTVKLPLLAGDLPAPPAR